MSIPKILALDFDYNLTTEDLEKTINLKLDINKEEFKKLNEDRKSKNITEIKIEEIHNLVVKGKVSYNDNCFKFKMNPNDDEIEFAKIIEPLLEINIDYFNNNKTEYLHFCPNFNKLMTTNNFNAIVENYYIPLKENEIKRDIGQKNYNLLNERESKFNVIFKTLINQPAKQISELFLPALSNNLESQFFNEIENDNYKYLIYAPENYVWKIPMSMNNEIINTKSVKMTLRYLRMDEIEETRNSLLSDDEYLKNMGKEIFTKEINLNSENSFEEDWSTDEIKQNNSVIKSNILPKFSLDKNQNIFLTPAGKVSDFLLKMYFGVNSKFFEQKLKVEENKEEINQE